MSHRFSLLLLTCLTCFSVGSATSARVSVACKSSHAEPCSAATPAPAHSISIDRPLREDQPRKDLLPPAPSVPPLATQVITAIVASPAAPVPVHSSSAAPSSLDSTPIFKEWAWWGTLALFPIGVGVGVLYRLRPQTINSSSQPNTATDAAAIAGKETPNREPEKRSQPLDANSEDQLDKNQPDETQPGPIALSTTTRLAKTDGVEELIRGLHSPDPIQRRKAIWDLGQQGDSRAIQPLVDLLIDSDSNQRGLILAAVSEISIRVLKPVHRALLVSIQDDSATVRKNAVRDVTRMFNLVAQISQLLHYAGDDADPEVRETAAWALEQLKRIRSFSRLEDLSPLGWDQATPTPRSLDLLSEATHPPAPSAETIPH